MTDADNVRFLAELAGWTFALHDGRSLAWAHPDGRKWQGPNTLDYPHSLDAIARDLLPLLREKGWEHYLVWNGDTYRFLLWTAPDEGCASTDPEPARAAFEAIFEALHGGEE